MARDASELRNEEDDDEEEELETEVLFEAYAVVGPMKPLEPTDETLGMWQDRATDVVDVGLVADDEEPPEGYVALRRTPSGECASLFGSGENRFFLCVKRRGRERRSNKNELPATALRAVTQLRIVKNAAVLDDDESLARGTTFSRALFGARRSTPSSRFPRGGTTTLSSPPQKSKNELWKLVERTASGKAEARLRNGWLAVRYSRLTDARKEPLVDIAVLSSTERLPQDYSPEASVPGGSSTTTTKLLGASLLSQQASICVKRGKRCGACDVTWRAAVLDTYPRYDMDKTKHIQQEASRSFSSSEEDEEEQNDETPKAHNTFRRASSGLSSTEKRNTPLAAWLEWEVVAMLTWPNGLKLRRGSVSSPPPVSFAAYSLVGDGRQPTYVSALYFYEPLQSNDIVRARRLAAEQVEPLDAAESGFALYAPKCVSILTRTPGVADAAKRWLASLYTLALSCNETPLERIVAHTINRVPAPVRGGAPLCLRMHASLPPIEMRLNRQPPDAELPPLGASASVKGLFACLSPSRCAAVLGAALVEKRLLFISKRPQLVTDACEALRAMLFPLRWEGVYVPRLARPILDTLDFPGAVLAGVEDEDQHTGESLAALAVERARDDFSSHGSHYYQFHSNNSGGYVLIFLDVDKVVFEENEYYKSPLPEPLCGALIKRWSKVCDHAGVGLNRERDRAAADHVFDNAEPPSASRGAAQRRKTQNKTFYDSSDDEHSHDGPPEWTSSCDRAARDAALVLMVQLLNEYAEYLVVPKVDYYSVSSTSLFRNEQFIQSATGSSLREFRRSLIATQAFARFIQRRLETTDPELVLFDECAAALRSAAEVHASAIVRGDALLLDAVDAGHHMKRLLAKSAEAKSITKEEHKSPRTPVSNFVTGATERRKRQHTPSSTRSERLDWHRSSSRWLDEMLLKAPAAQNAGCIAGTDTRGRPRIEVPAAPVTKDEETPKRYSYFVLGRGLSWPCPLDEALLPSQAEQRQIEMLSRRNRRKVSRRLSGSDMSSASTARALARSQAEILLDMGLSVAGLRLGGGENSRGTGPLTPPIAADAAARATAVRQLLHAYGAWFLFAPALVNAHRRRLSKKESTILRGLGAAPPALLCALGVLERVMAAPCDPDEAIFRALLVAAGRSGPACRPVVADLFTQLRQKGIRPNSLTLSQYTRAIAQHTESSEDYRFFVTKSVPSTHRPHPASSHDSSNHDSNDDDSHLLSRLTILQDQKEDESLNESEPPLIAALAASDLLGTETAALLRLGLNRHRHLRGLGHVTRFSVYLRKPMGIIFEEERGKGQFGVFVSRLKPDSNAERSGLVRCGDVLIAVGETRCENMDFDTCIQLIKAESLDTIHIVLERPRKNTATSNSIPMPVIQHKAQVPVLAVAAGKPPSPEDDENGGGSADQYTEDLSSVEVTAEATAVDERESVPEEPTVDDVVNEDSTGEAAMNDDSKSFDSSTVDVDIVVQKVSLGGLGDEMSETATPNEGRNETFTADEEAVSSHIEVADAPEADQERVISSEADSCSVEESDSAAMTPQVDASDATDNTFATSEDEDAAAEKSASLEEEEAVSNIDKTHENGSIMESDTESSVTSVKSEPSNNAQEKSVATSLKVGQVKTQSSEASLESSGAMSDTASRADSTESERARMTFTTFVPSRESIAKAAVALSGAVDVAKASTKAIGNAGGAAYDYSARRLASLVEEESPKIATESKEGGVSARTSAPFFNLLQRFENEEESESHASEQPLRVAIIWSGCVSPHHPREPPLDEEIMAAWPEELGQREVRCPFTARSYVPQLAYAVLEVAEAPPGEDDTEIWVRLWRPQQRERAGINPLTPPTLRQEGSSGELLSLHQAALSSAWAEGTAIGPFSSEASKVSPVPLSALLMASGVDTMEENSDGGEEEGKASSFTDDELRRANCELSEGTGRCAYLSPLQLRYDLELQLQRRGERALETTSLALKTPALFWCLWWYCARLDLPLPTLLPKRKSLSFRTPDMAVTAWSRKAALAAGAAALRSKLQGDIALAAKQAVAPKPVGLLDPVRAALLGPIAASTEKAQHFERATHSERVLDACALFLDARSSTADTSRTLAIGADDLMYRVLLRLNEPSHPGFLSIIGSLENPVDSSSYDDHLSVSLFDHAYRQALATLDQTGATGLQSRDYPCSERAVIFRTIFSPLF